MFYTPEEFAELEAESPKTCKCLRVKDDSMRPILFKGDRIVFDIAQTDIVQGGVYVLAIDNEYLIRRLFKKLSGVILIKTFDAELIGDEELDEKTFSERMQIKGRVIAKKGSGGLK